MIGKAEDSRSILAVLPKRGPMKALDFTRPELWNGIMFTVQFEHCLLVDDEGQLKPVFLVG